MICPNCRKNIETNAEVCPHCGSPAPFSSKVNYRAERLMENLQGGGGVASPSADNSKDIKLLTDIVKTGLGRTEKRLNAISRVVLVAVLLCMATMVLTALSGRETKKALREVSLQLEMQEQKAAQTAREAEEAAIEEQAIPQKLTLGFEPNLTDNSVAQNMPAEQQFVQGESLKIEDMIPQCSGKTFTGWNLRKDGTGAQYAPGAWFDEIDKDTILYAQWEDAAEEARENMTSGTFDGSEDILEPEQAGEETVQDTEQTVTEDEETVE